MADVPVLDMNAPDWGLIQPPYRGAKFTQRGHYFDSQGKYIWSEGQEPPAEPAAAEIEEEPAEAVVVSATDEVVDLQAWADGTANYPWFSVKKAVLDTFNVQVANKAQALSVIKDPPSTGDE